MLLGVSAPCQNQGWIDAMSELFAKSQRLALIRTLGKPTLSVEFDVFASGKVSMWTHFDHGMRFEATE
ncbi:MAG: hypothetical protein ACYC9L_17455 [Sulfuricaulis sp.]